MKTTSVRLVLLLCAGLCYFGFSDITDVRAATISRPYILIVSYPPTYLPTGGGKTGSPINRFAASSAKREGPIAAYSQGRCIRTWYGTPTKKKDGSRRPPRQERKRPRSEEITKNCLDNGLHISSGHGKWLWIDKKQKFKWSTRPKAVFKLKVRDKWNARLYTEIGGKKLALSLNTKGKIAPVFLAKARKTVRLQLLQDTNKKYRLALIHYKKKKESLSLISVGPRGRFYLSGGEKPKKKDAIWSIQCLSKPKGK